MAWITNYGITILKGEGTSSSSAKKILLTPCLKPVYAVYEYKYQCTSESISTICTGAAICTGLIANSSNMHALSDFLVPADLQLHTGDISSCLMVLPLWIACMNVITSTAASNIPTTSYFTHLHYCQSVGPRVHHCHIKNCC